jgi:hypothetical protein
LERARGDKGGGRAVGPCGSAGATLGDVLKQKLGDLTKGSDEAEDDAEA